MEDLNVVIAGAAGEGVETIGEVLSQRPGPATGLPTRTAQGDLLFAVYAGHGEFPKLVMAPCDAKDAFQKKIKM